MGIIYHDGLKNYEHYTPAAVEGIYRDWQKCCDVQARLAAIADLIGCFSRLGIESEASAISKFENWKAHAESHSNDAISSSKNQKITRSRTSSMITTS